MFELNEEEEKRIQMRLERDAKYIERREKELAEEKGLKRGIRKTQITTAKELIKFGMKIEDISKVTKLTEKEIQDIQAKMKQKSSREK